MGSSQVKDGVKDTDRARAVAIADYSSPDPSDLDFVRGDIIHVLSQNSTGWWRGRLEGQRKQGIFPRTYVMLQSEMKPRRIDIGSTFLALREVAATKELLGVLSGDLLYVDYVDGKFCSGTNLRTKQRGKFPFDCLDCKLTEVVLGEKGKGKGKVKGKE
jgi:hypothetical protein